MKRLYPLIILLFSLSLHAQETTDYSPTMPAIEEMIQDTYGTTDALEQNVITPMMSDSQLTTLDGSKSFSAGMTCNNSTQLLELFAQPLPSGDLGSSFIRYDSTGDGTMNQTYTLPNVVSGICGNGYVSCNAGTWENCQAFKPNINTSGQLITEPVPFTDLGGCYCINSSCGSNLVFNNLSLVISNLATVFANTVTRLIPNAFISDIQTESTISRVYGSQVSDCQNTDSTQLDSVYSDPVTALQTTPQEQAINNQLYQMVFDNQNNSENGNTFHTCTRQRNVTIDDTQLTDVISYNSGQGNIVPITSNKLRLTLGQEGDNYWNGNCTLFTEKATFTVNKPERIIDARFIKAHWDDHIRVSIKNLTTGQSNTLYTAPDAWGDPSTGWKPSSCERNTQFNTNPNLSFKQFITEPGQYEFTVEVFVAGAGEGYAQADITVSTGCQLNPDDIIDTCTTFDTNPTCQLYDEQFDGVKTYTNGIRTGLSPLSQSQEIVSNSCSFNVTRDWFQGSASYTCEANTTYNFDDALTRTQNISDTTTSTGFQDLPMSTDGTTNPVNYNLNYGATYGTVQQSTCTQTCKTSMPRENNEAQEFDVLTNTSNQQTKNIISYKACISNTCPLDSGETLVNDCACLNQFGEAFAAMHSVRMSSQDMICSSGEKAPTPPELTTTPSEPTVPTNPPPTNPPPTDPPPTDPPPTDPPPTDPPPTDPPPTDPPPIDPTGPLP